MRVLGLIPARGGSKGIPRKNLSLLAGRPLIAYTCDAAVTARSITRTILSSDDEEIAAVARAYGIEVPFIRPVAISSDDASMMDVARHAVHWMRDAGERPDIVVILQPTSPLRQASHIDAAVELLASSGADAVVSVVRVPHHFGPSSLMWLDGERLIPLEPVGSLRRQDKPTLFARNGPAILAFVPAVLEREHFYAGDVRGFEMSLADSVDIDSVEDLALAEFYLRRRAERA